MNSPGNALSRRIRLATTDDIDAIFSIRTRVKENHLSREELTEIGITPDVIRDAILATPCLWVAEIGSTPAGFSMVDLEDGSVFAMFILPQYEGLGLGRSLMEKAEEALFKIHTSIWLETGADSRAEGFYQKLGWQIVERYDDGDIRFEKLKS